MRNPFARSVKLRDGFPVLPGAFPVLGHIPMVYRGMPGTTELVREVGKIVWIHAGFGMWILGCSGPDAHARDDDEQPLTDREVLDNLRLLILGGHETISSTLAWTLLYLAHRPELWDALVEEAKRAERIPESPEEARAFPFAEALFRETVRMHPAFGSITRKSVAPFELYGKTLPVGALVAVDLWGISHDEGVFPEPMTFRPARWMGRSANPSALEICQFGAGPHFCLGYPMAWLEGVQYGVALAREIGGKGLRPVLRDEDHLRPIYMPTNHPTPKAVVDFR